MELVFQDQTQKDVGKFLKATKHMTKWTFAVAGKQHEAALYESVVSGKLKVTLDGQVMLERKVPEEGRRSGVAVETAELNLFFMKIGSKWEFRVNDVKFVEHRKAERLSLPPRIDRGSDDGLDNVLKDLSPAPQSRSPALSPIDRGQQNRFFASEIVATASPVSTPEEDEEENPFAVDERTVQAQLQNSAATPQKKTENSTFRKQPQNVEYIAVDTWGQEESPQPATPPANANGSSPFTRPMVGMQPGFGESPSNRRTPERHTNPFMDTNEDERGSIQSAQRDSNNLWRNFSIRTEKTADFPQAVDTNSFAAPEEPGSPMDSEFVTKGTFGSPTDVQLQAAQSASFVPSRPSMPQSARNDWARGNTFPNTMRLNFVKKNTTGTAHPTKPTVGPTASFLPKPDAMRQSLPHQTTDYFADFRPKYEPPKPQPTPQFGSRTQNAWMSQSHGPQPSDPSNRMSMVPLHSDRQGFPTPTDPSRYSLQNGQRWTPQPPSHFPAPSPPANPSFQKPTREAIQRAAQKADDDQFLNF